MHKIVIVLLLLVSTCSATRFLFAIEAKCDYDKVFVMVVSHWEDDSWYWIHDEDQVADRETFSGYKKLFFYQKGQQKTENGAEFELYARFYHNCTSDGRHVKYKHNLWNTKKAHGLEYVEYYVDLTDAKE
ncbi:hypothetical protein GCK72_000180 [Caenorhabditis remanei]|uniref:Uncharacterized protein n=1 Tax=Caenorhabditis remanei TaxID=31234 RepID=A0A6A5HKF9_CAERE|nr:hypothetical protein GCK72_000180 [Caenorhabditis remanei]KAF1768368.1 hypothetical protein GCK72_000180 [Caenorhabditis remanei]